MTRKRSIFSYLEVAACLYIAVVFVQSLFFKFTNAPETQYIFGTLDKWAAGFLVAGLFNPGGIFSAKVIGSAELVASVLLLTSLLLGSALIRFAGALVAFLVISGAIFFHLFTPLGVVIQGDGGLLFSMACGVWVCAVFLLARNLEAAKQFLARRRPA